LSIDTTTGMSAPPIGMMISTPMHEGQRQQQPEVDARLLIHEAHDEEQRGQAQHQVELVLAGKLHRRALEQAELVFARQLAKGDDRAAEGDGADGRAQRQLEPVAIRNRRRPWPRCRRPRAPPPPPRR
jgi:hypothetical protein